MSERKDIEYLKGGVKDEVEVENNIIIEIKGVKNFRLEKMIDSFKC